MWQQQGSVPGVHLFMASRLCSIMDWLSASATPGSEETSLAVLEFESLSFQWAEMQQSQKQIMS